jgi:hypothetical protein
MTTKRIVSGLAKSAVCLAVAVQTSATALALTSTPLCTVQINTPEHYKISRILGASHQPDRMARFVFQYGDKSGNPVSVITPDFIPQYMRLQFRALPVGADEAGCVTRKGRHGKAFKDCSYVERPLDGYQAFEANTKDQFDLLASAPAISITPLFLRDRSLFCMAQAATLLASKTPPAEAKTMESRILFFSDFGAPLNSTIVIQYEKQ